MSPEKVSIRFARGLDRVSTFPDVAKNAGLRHRIAVIQDTYVASSPDMVFDEALWRALAEFVTTFAASTVFVVEGRTVGRQIEVPLQTFLESWSARAEDEKCPPHMLIARDGGDVILCMVTDRWCDVGGPQPYHDSYTYSLYANVELEGNLMAFLRSARDHGKWQLSADVIPVSEGPEPTLIQRLTNWLR